MKGFYTQLGIFNNLPFKAAKEIFLKERELVKQLEKKTLSKVFKIFYLKKLFI